MKDKILITGGLGYIGSHTAVDLLTKGFDVVIVDDLSNSDINVLGRIVAITGKEPTFYQVDVTDKTAMGRIFAIEQSVAVVIHFAAYKAVGESVHAPLKYFRNNLTSLISVLEVMVEYNTNKIVFSSSATVYGEPASFPVTEDSLTSQPMSAYGSTKQMGEEILRKIVVATDVHCIALRYFNPVGAHRSGYLGELPKGTPNNLMPLLTQAAAGLIEKLIIFGNDYPTNDGTCVRDYVHVMDIAMAHSDCCHRLLCGGTTDKYEVFNIGTGRGYSILELIQNFEQYNNVKIPFVLGERRPGDVPVLYADVTKAKQLLGWKAKYDIEDMVRTAWSWQQFIIQ